MKHNLTGFNRLNTQSVLIKFNGIVEIANYK